jgi:myo-inositol catabolism protein IolS
VPIQETMGALKTQDLQQIDAIGRIVTDHLDNNPVMWNWS